MEKYSTWIAGAILAGILVVGIFSLGSNSAKHRVCDRIGGVYIQTYNGYECVQLTVIELK